MSWLTRRWGGAGAPTEGAADSGLRLAGRPQQPGKKAKVTVTVEASRLPTTQIGDDRTAVIAVQTDTPYPVPTIPVSMRLASPKS